MITGDYPATANAIAQQAGLERGELVTGEQLETLNEAELAGRVATAGVFARSRRTRSCASSTPTRAMARSSR